MPGFKEIVSYVMIGSAHFVKGACCVVAFYLIVSSIIKRLSALFPVFRQKNALYVSDVLTAPVKRLLPPGVTEGSADISPLVSALILLFIGFGIYVFIENAMLFL